MRRSRFALWGVAIAGTLTACVTEPITHRRAFRVVPDSYMNSMGLQAYNEVLHTSKISHDRRLIDVVTRVGTRIAAATGEHYDWQFTVIDDPKTVNAFCLPGGKVAVYTGLLPIAQNEAALAAVLGHEIAHATARHGAERMSQALAAQGALALADVSLQNNSNRNAIMAALGLGTQVGVLLPYSRVQEAEADHIGLVYMAKAGYDPEEAVKLWSRMSKLGGAPPEILSDHPASEKRMEALRNELPEVAGLYAASQKQPSRPLP